MNGGLISMAVLVVVLLLSRVLKGIRLWQGKELCAQGFRFHTGRDGFDRNAEQAIKFFRLAADKGNLDAMRHLGYVHALGQGVEQNYDAATDWYNKAANAGDVKAKWSLAIHLIPKDVEASKRLLEEIEN